MGLTIVKSGVIEDDSITSANIDNATIVTGDVAPTTITNAKMAVDPSNASNLNSGSIPAARLGNVGEYDEVKVLDDIATLALHQAVQNNQAAYNLSNAFIDQFEDSSGIDVLTQCIVDSAEYVSTVFTVAGNDSYTVLLLHMDGANDGTTFTDSSASPHTTSAVGGAVTKTGIKKFGTASAYFNGSASFQFADSADWFMGTGPFTLDMWVYNSDKTGRVVDWVVANYYGFYARPNGQSWMQGRTGGDLGIFADYDDDTWTHLAWDFDTVSGKYYGYQDGVVKDSDVTSGSMSDMAGPWRVGRSNTDSQGMTGYIDELRLSKGISRYGGSAFTPEPGPYGTTTAHATANYTSTTETAAATVSKMSIVVLYKNESGTATLDTDLVAQVSSNGGTNYTSAPLTAGGTFSTGILIAKSNDITISNTGTAPKYKISFANQLFASKETRVYGVAILY